MSDNSTTDADQTRDDRGISVARDASGNAFVTGDNNSVKVIIYQTVSQQRQPEEPRSTEIGPNPYMGLLAFHEEDAERFFGREKQIARLWEKLRDLHQHSSQRSATPRVLPILGPSGSGKSSVARAGLIPELARRPLPGWRDARVAVFTPGSHPLEALAGVLARMATGDSTPVEKSEEFERVLKRQSDTGQYNGLRRIADALPEIANVPLIVMVDQFEEIYSLCDDKTEQRAFIENLLHAASDASGRASVVITLRTDFLSETQTHEVLNRLICEQQVMIPALNEQELREVIAKPSALAGHPLDDATITLLVNDAKDREGALPLLQFALTRIWDGLTQGIEPAVTYHKIGGVGGALAGEAQRIYDGLDEDQKRIAKRIFLGLVQLGEGTRDTRRRAVVSELVSVGEDASEVDQVIRRFSGRDARLVTLSADERGTADTAEVTHEALFTHWEQLHEWLVENRDDIRFSRRLAEAANTWKQQGRPDGGLWRRPNLDLLREYHERIGSEMTELQTEFFQRSDQADKRRVFWKWALAAAFSVAVMVALAALFDSWKSRNTTVQASKELIGKQIDNLQTATADGARDILKDLKAQSQKDPQVVPLLRARLEKGDLAPERVARIRLAVLVVADDREQTDQLSDRMLDPLVPPDEFLLVREKLSEFQDENANRKLWDDLKVQQDRSQWFRTAVALAAFDARNEEWKQVGPDVAEDLIRQEPAELMKWIDALRPVGDSIVSRLEETYISRQPDRAAVRPNAAIALATYATPERLAELLVDYADAPATFSPLMSRLRATRDGPPPRQFLVIPDQQSAGAFKILNEVLAEKSPEFPTATSTDEQANLAVQDLDRLYSRQANAAITLFLLGDQDKLLKLLVASADPTLRTYLIERLPRLGVETERFIHLLMNTGSADSSRQALILALGTYQPEPISSGELKTWENYLLDTFKNDPTPGLHAAAEWALNQWKRDSRLQHVTQQFDDTRKQWMMNGQPISDRHRWYVNKAGQTMVLIAKPGRIQVGSPPNELHEVTIDWGFAIAASEISEPDLRQMAHDEEFVNDFQARLRDEDAERVNAIKNQKEPKDLPAVEVSWYLAAAYCNWLSQKDGLPVAQWCYEVDKQTNKYVEGMTIKNWSQDGLSGYRLPLDAEWEYACRTGTRTRWYCGDSEEHLSRYAPYDMGDPLAVGSLKPNDWGLYDMHGNAWEWCQDAYQEQLAVDIAGELSIDGTSSRVLRGGSFFNTAHYVRSAYRFYSYPTYRSFDIGFRVARTYN